MKIKLEKGRKFDGDKIIKITTKESEVFNLTRLLLIINQLALNEQKRYKLAPDNKYNLWFKQAVERFMEDGIFGIDLLSKDNEYLLEEYAKRWKIPHLIQTKLSDFENENPN